MKGSTAFSPHLSELPGEGQGKCGRQGTSFAECPLPQLHPTGRGSVRGRGWLVLCFLLLLSNIAGAAPSLRSLRTTYYNIHTDLEPSLAADMGKRMDAMYLEYSRRLANFVLNKELPLQDVYIFRRQEDYLQFTDRSLGNTGGVYITGRNILAAFLEGQGRDGLRRTLQHEAFHQFAHNCISPNMPVWLNEGLAQVFEEGIFSGDRFSLGQVPPRRVRQLQYDLTHRQLADFAQFMGISNDLWSTHLADNAAAGATQYNQAWAMVHFLINAPEPRTGAPKYRARLVRMLDLLHQGRSADDAFTDAFSNNVEGFQARFMEYAQNIQATPDATMMERQTVLADLLTELNGRGIKVTSIRQLRDLCARGKFTMHYQREQIKWTTDPEMRDYFCNPKGEPLADSELFLDTTSPGPIPDLICRTGNRLQLRTRFYQAGGKLEHEVLTELAGHR